ncbi:FkbM family methyltransferase [Christensenellaceae bacterium OttesenSCG-928-K19]|nr:FkbM family methyltransferase [Christensenellaceae bacterium OttesenSCG-928-K19]
MDSEKKPTANYVRNMISYGIDNEDAGQRETQRTFIDLSGLMHLQGDEFVKEAFAAALLRQPSEPELEIFRGHRSRGATNEILAYIILKSDEISADIEKCNFEQYEAVFLNFSKENRLKNNKLVRWLHAAVTMPTRLKYYMERSLADDKRTQHLVGTSLAKLDQYEAEFSILKAETVVRNEMLVAELAAVRDELTVTRTYTELLKTEVQMLQNRIEQSEANVSEKVDGTFLSLNESVNNVAATVVGKANLSKTAISGFAGGVTVVQLNNYLLALPSEEWRLAMHLSLNSYFEPGSEKYFLSYIKPGMNVVDAGANLGVYTLQALQQGCHVYAFEPTPSTYALLKENVLMNGHQYSNNHTLFNNAVADREMDVEFSINMGEAGVSNSMYAEEGSEGKIIVHAVALDDVLKDVSHIDFVKIDVEGAEPLVLAGMKNIVKKNPDIRILMEFSQENLTRAGKAPGDLLDQIADMGLSMQGVDDDGNLKPAQREALLQNKGIVNLLLFHEGGRL